MRTTKYYIYIDYTKLRQQVLPREIAGASNWGKVTDLYKYYHEGKLQFWTVDHFYPKEFIVQHWLQKKSGKEYWSNVAIGFATRKKANDLIKKTIKK